MHVRTYVTMMIGELRNVSYLTAAAASYASLCFVKIHALTKIDPCR